jgi:hypothetical protein
MLTALVFFDEVRRIRERLARTKRGRSGNDHQHPLYTVADAVSRRQQVRAFATKVPTKPSADSCSPVTLDCSKSVSGRELLDLLGKHDL